MTPERRSSAQAATEHGIDLDATARKVIAEMTPEKIDEIRALVEAEFPSDSPLSPPAPRTTPPVYFCMACPETFENAESCNAHHDATGHNQTWRPSLAFGASVPAASLSGTPAPTPISLCGDIANYGEMLDYRCELELGHKGTHRHGPVSWGWQFDAHGSAINAMQDDIAEMLRAFGISDHARSMSPHMVIQTEILPAIRALQPAPTVPSEAEYIRLLEREVGVARTVIRRLQERLYGAAEPSEPTPPPAPTDRVQEIEARLENHRFLVPTATIVEDVEYLLARVRSLQTEKDGLEQTLVLLEQTNVGLEALKVRLEGRMTAARSYLAQLERDRRIGPSLYREIISAAHPIEAPAND